MVYFCVVLCSDCVAVLTSILSAKPEWMHVMGAHSPPKL